jgi:hypothetical protein
MAIAPLPLETGQNRWTGGKQSNEQSNVAEFAKPEASAGVDPRGEAARRRALVSWMDARQSRPQRECRRMITRALLTVLGWLPVSSPR